MKLVAWLTQNVVTTTLEQHKSAQTKESSNVMPVQELQVDSILYKGRQQAREQSSITTYLYQPCTLPQDVEYAGTHSKSIKHQYWTQTQNVTFYLKEIGAQIYSGFQTHLLQSQRCLHGFISLEYINMLTLRVYIYKKTGRGILLTGKDMLTIDTVC